MPAQICCGIRLRTILPFDESKMKSGFVVGGDVAYTFNNNVALASGISLLVSNGQFSALTEYYPVEMKFSEVNVKTMSLEIPLKVGYTFRLGSSISLTPMVGFYGRYGVDSLKAMSYHALAERLGLIP